MATVTNPEKKIDLPPKGSRNPDPITDAPGAHPIEAGVGFFVALDKGEFVGRAVLADQKAKGTSKKLAAFKMTGKSAPPRPGYSIWSSGPQPKHLGQVVSGTQSPSLGVGIGLGYVPPEFAKSQTPLEIEIRGNRVAAVVVPKPFYKKT